MKAAGDKEIARGSPVRASRIGHEVSAHAERVMPPPKLSRVPPKREFKETETYSTPGVFL